MTDGSTDGPRCPKPDQQKMKRRLLFHIYSRALRDSTPRFVRPSVRPSGQGNGPEITSNGGYRREEKSHKHWSPFTMLSSSVTAIFLCVRLNQEQLYAGVYNLEYSPPRWGGNKIKWF